MKCADCPYYWADVNEQSGEQIGHSYCHYQYDDGYAPCEVEDEGNFGECYKDDGEDGE